MGINTILDIGTCSLHSVKNAFLETELTSQFVLRHWQTRWLSLDKVLVGIVEQFGNIIGN